MMTEKDMKARQLLEDNNAAVHFAAEQEERMHFVPVKKPKRKSRLQKFFEKIPLLNVVLKHFDDAGDASISLAEVQGHSSKAIESAASGFHFANLALTAIDFIIIPAIWIAAFTNGDKSPIKVTKAFRWTYSAVALGLLIAGFLVPGGAMAIVITSGALFLANSIYLMSKTLFKHYAYKNALNKTNECLREHTLELEQVHQDTIELEAELNEAIEKSDSNAAFYLRRILKIKSERFDILHKQLQEDYDNQAFYSDKILKLNLSKIVYRSTAIILASVAFTGIVLSFILPPVGVLLLAISAFSATLFLFSRILVSLFMKKSTKHAPLQKETEGNADLLEPDDTKIDERLDLTYKAVMITDAPTDVIAAEPVIPPLVAHQDTEEQANALNKKEIQVVLGVNLMHDSTAITVELLTEHMTQHINTPPQKLVTQDDAPPTTNTVTQSPIDDKKEEEEGEGEGPKLK